MRHEHALAAARLLTEAWQIGMTVRELPEEWRPRTAAEAYRIQDLLAAELGFPVAGWKIGGTSAAARRILKTRSPFAGRIFASRVFESGTMLPSSGYRLRGLEGEFAFRLKKALPPRKRAYGLAEVSAAVGTLHPAIEVIDSRYADWLKVGAPSLIADQGANAALILGPPVPRWRSFKLDKLPVRMLVNGREVGAGTSADCLGHPMASLLWLANLMRARDGIAAGQIVSTGTCTGLYQANPGDRAIADFGRFGKIEVGFTN